MSNADHKTKDFLKKIDYLVERGLVKNATEVVNSLGWNKSVMSSVRNGNLPVPQHIYNKFKEVYAEHFTPVEDAGDYKEKYIALLERQAQDQKEIISRLIEVEKDISEAKTNQRSMYAFQMAFQETVFALLHATKSNRKEYGEKVISFLEKFQKEGIPL